MKNAFTFAIAVILLTSCTAKADGFERVGYWKKDKNRVFSIYSLSNDLKAIESYAKRLPWSPGYSTAAYFFNNRGNTPDITLAQDPYQWPKKFEPYWIAVYWHNANGTESFNQITEKERG